MLNAGVPAIGGSFHFGFRVAARETVGAWFARARAAGVRVLAEPATAGEVYVGRLADPDGYGVEIYAEIA